MAKLFGTDGVRGVANVDLTAKLALDLSVAAAQVLGQAGVSSRHRPVAVVGRDPRASGEFLEAAVVAGLASSGVDVRRVGVLPTPAVAYLTAAFDADFGVMLSASHNPMPDNGIKFFARGWPQARRRRRAGDRGCDDHSRRTADRCWRRSRHRSSRCRTALCRSPDRGAAYSHRRTQGRPRLRARGGLAGCAGRLRALGADVIAIHNTPSGLDINDGCGSTHLDSLRAAVVEAGADAGFAFDGDADRCLAVDRNGGPVDGDHLLAILALYLHEDGALADDTVVATVMSNLGFLNAMRNAGVDGRPGQGRRPLCARGDARRRLQPRR